LRRQSRVERLGDRYVLAAITGEIFGDFNQSLKRESSESGIVDRLVFVDLNQNSQLDDSEPIAISDALGQFQFPEMEPGEYLVRLFSGGPSQVQTYPVAADLGHLSSNPTDATQLLVGGDYWYALNPEIATLEFGAFSTGKTDTIVIDGTPRTSQVAPDGKLLVLGSKEGIAASWVIDPVSGLAQSLVWESQQGLSEWSSLTLDQQGSGLVIGETATTSVLYTIEYGDSGQWSVVPTATAIEKGTVAFSSAEGSRELLAQPQGGAFEFSLWSRSLGEPIAGASQVISGVSEVLGFNDLHGMLLTRDASQQLSVFDVDANFALLNQFHPLSGRVAFDGASGRLASLGSEQGLLEIHDVVQGDVFAAFEVDLSGLGEVKDLVWRDSQVLLIVAEEGIQEISLRRAVPAVLTVSTNRESNHLVFGLQPDSTNQIPEAPSSLHWILNEDTELAVSANEFMSQVNDPNGNQLVVIQQSEATHGIAVIGYDGSIDYRPDENFFGTDVVQVRVHDGQAVSGLITLEFEVLPAADPPTGIVGSFADLHSNLSTGAVVGSFTVLDPDVGEGAFPVNSHEFFVSDPRFDIVGKNLIFVGGFFDFAKEPSVELEVSVFDTGSNRSVASTLPLRVLDPAKPILAVQPDTVRVEENTNDVLLTVLSVHDPEYVGEHVFEVNDSRFRIEGNQLWIEPDALLDHETEPEIALIVTVSRENEPSVSVRETLLIEVTDVPEQPSQLYLSNQNVSENVFGATVGNVFVDGGPPSSQLSLSVNDSRFEIVNGLLKLIDQEMVERQSQTEIELVITARDDSNIFESLSASFVVRVLENSNPYHNLDNPYDVDRNGSVTALDALAIINYLNVYGPGPIHRTDEDYAYDVNADQMVTALDVLLVLNEINRQRLRGEAVGNGEQVQPDLNGSPQPTSSPSDYSVHDAVESQSVVTDELGEASSEDLENGPSLSVNMDWSEQIVDRTIEVMGDSLFEDLSGGLSDETSQSDLKQDGESGFIDLLSDD